MGRGQGPTDPGFGVRLRPLITRQNRNNRSSGEGVFYPGYGVVRCIPHQQAQTGGAVVGTGQCPSSYFVHTPPPPTTQKTRTLRFRVSLPTYQGVLRSPWAISHFE